MSSVKFIIGRPKGGSGVTEVQSVLLPKKDYTYTLAKHWLSVNHFRSVSGVGAGKYWRFTQHLASEYEKDSFRTIAAGQKNPWGWSTLDLLGQMTPAAKHAAAIPSGKTLTYKGVRIMPTSGGYRTSIEYESLFDSKADAKKFIDKWRRNPMNPGRHYLTHARAIGYLEPYSFEGSSEWSLKIMKEFEGKEHFVIATVHATKEKAIAYGRKKGVKEFREKNTANPIQSSKETYDTGAPVAEYFPVFEEWAANSQYGYALSWHKTKAEAIQAARDYYKDKPELTATIRNPFLESVVEGLATGTGITLGAGMVAPLVAKRVQRALKGVKGVVDKGKGNKNPSSDSLRNATTLAEQFHGRPSREIIEILEQDTQRDNFAMLGDLQELELVLDGKSALPIGFKGNGNNNDTVFLAADPEGNQLYFIGGDQALPLDDIDMLTEAEREKDLVTVGQVHSITYFADKHHLDGPAEQKDGTSYWHVFGEDGGEKPILVYDKLNERMQLVGGSYRVEDRGIVN